MTDLTARVIALRLHAQLQINECRRLEEKGQTEHSRLSKQAFKGDGVLADKLRELDTAVFGVRVARETWEEVLSLLGDPP